MSVLVRPSDVLVAVDIQYDFLPGGALAVADGDSVIAPVNRLAAEFKNVVMTQDWHPADHVSFASTHEGAAPLETVQLSYGTQVLWPDHCVWETRGAELSHELDIAHAQLVIRKGYNRAVDSYSGFQEADRRTRTGLAGYLRERGLERVFVVGLATDFCVAWTALDARDAGFETYVIEDATRGIDTAGSMRKAFEDMDGAGVARIRTADILLG